MQVHPRLRGKTLARHPMSSVFGDMSPEELEELKEDIRVNGLREPITIHEGMVLDGWHRYQCLCALGRPLTANNKIQYDPEQDGKTPEAYVLSKNAFRRQMSAADRVRAVAHMLGYENAGRGGVVRERVTMKEVAEKSKTSEKTVQRTLGKPTKVLLKKEPTLESLKKREAMLEGQLAKVREQIKALSPKPAHRR